MQKTKLKFYQQTWFLPVVGVLVLGGVITAAIYSQPGTLEGSLRGAAEMTKTAKKVVPLPSKLAKPVVTAPTADQVFTNFPRLTSVEWTDKEKSVTHNVEISCDFCASATEKWSKPTVYSTAGSLFSGAQFPGDNQYRVRVQGVTATGAVTPWSDYVNFSFDTSSQLNPPKLLPEMFAPSPNTAANAFTTLKFGAEDNSFKWGTPSATNINYYVDYRVCFMNGDAKKCIDANVGQPKGTFVNYRTLTAAEWQSVKEALFGPIVFTPNSPPLHMLWSVEIVVTQKATDKVVSTLGADPWDMWIYLQ